MKKLLSIMVLVITSVMLATPEANAQLRGIARCLKAARRVPQSVSTVKVPPHLHVKPVGPIRPHAYNRVYPKGFNPFMITSQIPDSLRTARPKTLHTARPKTLHTARPKKIVRKKK